MCQKGTRCRNDVCLSFTATNDGTRLKDGNCTADGRFKCSWPHVIKLRDLSLCDADRCDRKVIGAGQSGQRVKWRGEGLGIRG